MLNIRSKIKSIKADVVKRAREGKIERQELKQIYNEEKKKEKRIVTRKRAREDARKQPLLKGIGSQIKNNMSKNMRARKMQRDNVRMGAIDAQKKKLDVIYGRK